MSKGCWQLKTWYGDIVHSATFWESWITIVCILLLGEIVGLYLYCRKRDISYEKVNLETSASNEGVEEEGVSPLQIDDEDEDDTRTSENSDGDDAAFSLFNQKQTLNNHCHVTPCCRYFTILTSRRSLYILRILLIMVLNLLLLFTLSFATISLMEIEASPHFTEGMQKLTPACSDPTLVCPAGNEDIERESAKWPPSKNDATRVSTTASSNTTNNLDAAKMQPFSYIIASDSQLYWFNGEFAEMGQHAIPSACSPSDSCGRCTGKHGLATNQRLKKAWESLMMGNVNTQNATSGSDLPIPNTLIMNGKLYVFMIYV